MHVYVYKNTMEGIYIIVCESIPLCFCFLHTGCKKAECGALLQSSIAPLVMFIGSLQRWSVSVEHTQQLIALPMYSTVKIINIFVGNKANCSRTTDMVYRDQTSYLLWSGNNTTHPNAKTTAAYN